MPLLVVGTFNTPELFTVLFDPTENDRLLLVSTSKALGNHSWLSTARVQASATRSLVGSADPPTHLYATCWTEPPSVAAYRLRREKGTVEYELLNTAETAARSGYVTVGQPANCVDPVLYSVGGPTGEVIGIDSETGAFDLAGRKHASVIRIADQGSHGNGRLQELDCVVGRCSQAGRTLSERTALPKGNAPQDHQDHQKLDGRGGKNNMDFGGLRHGAHGVDLSIDGTVAFVPDIGRNCIWVYDVNPNDGTLALAQKCVAGRNNDGPRHTIPHPGGRYIYCLQEHSSYVDVYELIKDVEGTRLELRQGVRVIPRTEEASLYWADEVRVSAPSSDGKHLYLYASTRGLSSETKGWVAVFRLYETGLVALPEGIASASEAEEREHGWALDLWQTPASGGWANAIEPAPQLLVDSKGELHHYAALTDSEVGVLRMLRFSPSSAARTDKGDTRYRIEEFARLELGKDPEGRVRQAATAVWL